MTDVAVASTSLVGREAGEDLAATIRVQMPGAPADALIVFASPKNDYSALLQALHEGSKPNLLVGCSSAGEFTGATSGTGLTTAIALRAADMRFNASLATELSSDRARATRELISGFEGMQTSSFRYRTAILLVDALAGYTDDLVDKLTLATGGMYRFVGGGAGDDAKFMKTHVFMGTEAHSDAAVALEILSNKPIGIGARHGWSPASKPMRVTQSDDACVVSLNVAPAVEAFEDHAAATNQNFDHADPLPFFLHNIVGVKTENGHRLRVPIGLSADGGVVCAAEVPAGSTAHIMTINSSGAADAAVTATRDAMDQVKKGGHTPKAALFFDCVATRLRLGAGFNDELDAVATELGTAQFAGFNSHGQIVRSEGQFNGFHNCTAVVCVFPD